MTKETQILIKMTEQEFYRKQMNVLLVSKMVKSVTEHQQLLQSSSNACEEMKTLTKLLTIYAKC